MITVNGTPPRTKRFLIIDDTSLAWAEDTFTQRANAIRKAEHALELIRQVEETLREAARHLDPDDPMIYKILSYPMSWDATEGCLRSDIGEWGKEQEELQSEIRQYNAENDTTPDD